MLFRLYDNLRTFTQIAHYQSLTRAAEALHLTKGALSHQIRNLEQELGFAVLHRSQKGISLTEKGAELLQVSRSAFSDIGNTVSRLQKREQKAVTLAVSTYFAARWLSPRLMNFMNAHPEIRLRIQPMAELQEIEDDTVDLVIRWGNGNWQDGEVNCLFLCPAFATGPRGINKRIAKEGFSNQTLLRDWKGSTAWREWHSVGKIPFEPKKDGLIIPDPNVRVQAIIDGQGLGLNDRLIKTELESGQLEQVFGNTLDDYGYFLVHMPSATNNPSAQIFANWLYKEGNKERTIS